MASGSARFDHIGRAKIAAEIMIYWGILVRQEGLTVTCLGGKVGFDFLARLYDAT